MQPLLHQDPEGAQQDPREGRVLHRRHRVRREEQRGDREGPLRPGQARRQALLQGVQDHQAHRDRGAACACAREAQAPAAGGEGEAPPAAGRDRCRTAPAQGEAAPAQGGAAQGEARPAAAQGGGGPLPVAVPVPVPGVAVRLLLLPRPRRLPLLLLRQGPRGAAPGPGAAAAVLPGAAVRAPAVPLRRRLPHLLRGGPLLRLRHHVIVSLISMPLITSPHRPVSVNHASCIILRTDSAYILRRIYILYGRRVHPTPTVLPPVICSLASILLLYSA